MNLFTIESQGGRRMWFDVGRGEVDSASLETGNPSCNKGSSPKPRSPAVIPNLDPPWLLVLYACSVSLKDDVDD